MKNALTIDLEDYFHVSAFADRLGPDQWDSCTSRLEQNTENILALLGLSKCRATFFILGWVAERYPALVRQIANAGHEIACHSHRHRLVYEMTPEEFRQDTSRAKGLLEDASGKAVLGYRAPSFSIREESFWAFGILAELGFAYDSSIFPVNHPNYGVPEASRFPFCVHTPWGSVIEFPMPTLEFRKKRSPLGGGAYLRLLPYWYTRWGIRHINAQEKQPVCVYLHPWELDTDQPRVQANLSARVRHYLGLRGMQSKLSSLLRDFEFCPMSLLVNEGLATERPVAGSLFRGS